MFAAAHLIAVAVATVVTSTLMLVAVISRLRVRRPLLAWRTGLLGGLPLSPVLFLTAVAAGMTMAWEPGAKIHPVLALGYPAIGLFWFVALWHARTTLITEYGIVHDVVRISRAVPWGRIVDYSTTPTALGGAHFIFFYRTQSGVKRLDIDVPDRQRAAFEKVVKRKLDDRFAFSLRASYSRHPSR